MFYLKIQDNKIVQAPKICIRKGYKIFGYNAPSNITMIQEDGYNAYAFPASQAEIVNGEIVKKEMVVVEPAPRTIFTKLEIRRACRALGLQEKLNAILNADAVFAADWHDATEIDLNDEMFIKAVEAGVFSDVEINQVKEHLQ